MILLCSCGAGRNNSLSKSNIMTTRKGLSVAQWFSKKDLTPEEIKTVDAILDYISRNGGPSGSPEVVARYAERKLWAMSLDGSRLSDIGPILALKKMTHLTLVDNFFSQSQIEELLTGLPELRTILVDDYIQCRPDLNPKVTCLK
jgi:hypothetical protein